MSTILQFLLILSIIIVTAKAFGYLSTLLGQPAVLGELTAGVVLGPSLLNLFGLGFITKGPALEATVRELAELGVVFLMFMAGLETNLKEMFKVGKVAAFSGVSGVITPVVLGTLLSLPFGYSFQQSVFIGIILAATSVSISAQTLLELGVLRRREGLALLGAAVLDDVLVVLLLSLFLSLGLGAGGGSLVDVLLVIGRMAAFFALTILLGLKLLPWLLAQVKKLPISQNLTAFTLVLVMLTAWASEFLGGVAMIVGAFLVGVLVGRTSYRHELERSFNVIIYAFFVPIFFVSIGLILNLGTVQASTWVFALAVSFVAIVSKIFGGGLGARLAGFDNLSSLRLSLGMVSRGEVGLIVATVGVTGNIINDQVYAAIVVMVLATTLFTPLALKWAFRREKETGRTTPTLEEPAERTKIRAAEPGS